MGAPGDIPFLMRLFGQTPDTVVTGSPSVTSSEVETGMDRLRKMFSLDEYGYQSKEITMIVQGTMGSTMVGGIIGGIIQSREGFVKFMENNQATKFYSHVDAKRELSRVMYLSFAKGAGRWAWRIGGFTGSYISLLTITSVYWGKESILDYIIAGGMTGGLFRANMGFKGVIAGSVLGSALGLIGGAASLLVLKTSGTSLAELREFSQNIKDARDNKVSEAVKKQLVQEYTDFNDGKLNDEMFKNLQVDDAEVEAKSQ